MLRVIAVTIALLVPSASALAASGTPPGEASTSADAGAASTAAGEGPLRYAPGELLVRFKPSAQVAARAVVRSALGARRVASLPVPGLQVMRLEHATSVRAAADALRRDPNVLYAEPNFYYRLSALPNDPRFHELWGFHNTGQSVLGSGGTPGADIDAPAAWDVTTGSSAVTVAVADSGIAYDHPDLKANIWTNPGETGGGRETNGRDDDRDGRIDDWRGWDFVSNDNDPRDLNGHGTHVAGTIGARGNNGTGLTGIDWRVKLMPLRVADGNGVVTVAAMIAAFDYAVARGARVVNASFGSPDFSQALLDAVRRNPKTLFVAAAGNGGDDGVSDDNDRVPQYPCNLTAPNIVCVAASDKSDRLAGFSNYGAGSVDLAAPGVDVSSTIPAYTDPLFSEGFENDIGATWVTGGINNTWGRTNGVANTGSYSLSDSPGATYLDNTESFAETATGFSLGGRFGCRLSYEARVTTEPHGDKLVIEASRDDVNWVTLSELSGSTGGAFVELSDDLSDFDGAPTVYLRFRLSSNGSLTADGAQLDDVEVRCLSSSYSGNEFAFEDGTSMAAPHVSGTAALILARYPSLGVSGVRSALLRGVDRKPAFVGKTASGGRLNLKKSLEQARRFVPTLRLSGAARQHMAARRPVVVYARCSQTCALVATGRLSLAGASSTLGLRKVARSAAGGTRKKLALKLSARALASARRALKRGRRVTATVKVTATTLRGNSIRASRKIRLTR